MLRRLRARLDEDRPFQLAAEIAFFFLLAMQPLLVVLTAVLAYLPLERLEPKIVKLLSDLFPGGPGERLAAIVLEVLGRRHPRLISLGLLAVLWTASSGTKAVIDATAKILRLGHDPRSWWRRRARALILTAALVALAALGGAFAAGVLQLLHAALGFTKEPRFARPLELSLGFLLLVSSVQLVYHFGPPRRAARELPGAVAAALAAIAASHLLALYARRFRDFDAVYGSLGAIVLLVLWFYVVGCALVLGAEVNAFLSARRRA